MYKDVKKEWQETQLHWDDKTTIQRQKVPKSVILNWRKINKALQKICREKKAINEDILLMVDIGCGSGKFFDGLESVINLYVGIDPSDKMLSYIAKKHNQHFVRGVGEDMPLQDNVADIVLLKSVLDQCFSPKDVLSESKRILKNKGWLLISLSNKGSYYSIIRKLYNRLRKHKSEHIFEKGNLFYFDINEVETMLKNEGFHIIRRLSFGYFVCPKLLERLIPENILIKAIDLADKLGNLALSKKGGGFIIIAEK